ncbi:MAG: hypothetical protein GVY17_05475 [Cyanobacteria bacterium]|nr:hypothetical protein [Cyanobacteria bacterium GSL.Bin21]
MRVNYQHVIQETLSRFRKMQGLYLLKTGEVKTVTHLADYLGVHRVTIQKWLKIYRQEGVSGLLREAEDQGGRPKQLEDSAIAHLQERLSQEEQGFRSYGEIQKWLNVIQLDQGKFHQSKDLKIPENIVLIFQPAASPELNPIERFWQYLKEELSWKIYEELEELKGEVRTILRKITPKTITSLTNWGYLQKALTVV